MMHLGKKMRPGQQNDPRILVDAGDEWLLDWKWTVVQNASGNLYASRWVRSTARRDQLLLHRVVLGAAEKVRVDHINGDGLDNRRANLRPATATQNAYNQRVSKNNTSGFKGVVRDKRYGLWQAKIRAGGRYISLGYFRDPEDAARAYDAKAREVCGEYALTNEQLGLVGRAVAHARKLVVVK